MSETLIFLCVPDVGKTLKSFNIKGLSVLLNVCTNYTARNGEDVLAPT